MSGTSRAGVWWTRAIVFLVMSVAFFLLSRTATDPDLLGHVRFGQEILEGGGIPSFDRYSFTAIGHEWINHEWATEVSLALAYELGGNRGLLLLKLLIAMAIVALVYRHMVRAGLEPLRAGILLVPITMLLLPGLVTVRPQMFTFLFLTLLLLTLAAAERGRARLVWLCPLIIAAWINFHGGVLAGLGVIGVWAGGRAFEWLAPFGSPHSPTERRRRALAGAAVFGLSAVALLANPYGPELPRFLIETATVPRPDISEWQPTPITSGRGIIYLVLLTASLLALHFTRAGRRPPLLFVFAALSVLPLMAVRHIPLFALGVGILLPAVFAGLPRLAAGASRSGRGQGRPIRSAMIALTGLVGVVMLGASAPALDCIRIDAHRAGVFPARAVEWIRRSGVEGDLVTFFDWGEYAIWHLGPDIRVSMDGRRETVYPDSVYREYLRFQNGREGWEAHVDRYGAELALVSRAWPMFSLMQLKPGWELVYGDSIAGVFAREGTDAAARLASTPVPELPQRGIGMCSP